MNKFTIFLVSLMLVAFSSMAFAGDLNITFDDDSDVANWSHYDETNVWTSETWDASGGVSGGGALKLTDGGYTFLAKRPVTGVMGKAYSLTIDINVDTWGGGDLTLSVQGLSSTEPSVVVSGNTGYTTFTLNGTADLGTSGYIRLYSTGSTTAPVVFVDNVVFDDGYDPMITINEIYYNPPTMQGSDSDFEFLELYNPGDTDIPLEGYTFTEGIEYTFVAADTIKAGGYFVLAYNSANYEGSVQWTTGGLKNSGEDIVLHDASGATVDSVNYDDWGSDWPKWADGSGSSLELVDYATDNNDPANWQASAFGGTPGAANGPRGIMVYFTANTATVPDTMSKSSVVQVRGSAAPLQWGGSSLFNLNPVTSTDEWGSSDYWTGHTIFPANVTYYKFYTNSSHSTVAAGDEWEHQGWEQNISDEANDRILDLSNFTGEDTTLAVQYVNGWADKPGQYAHPWTNTDSTFTVWLRVNMEGFEAFDPEQHVVGVRGSNTSDWGQTGEMSWSTTYALSQEADHPNGGSRQYNAKYFYSGAVHVPNRYQGTGLKWKFVVHYKDHDLSEDWGNMMWNPGLEEEISFGTSGNDTTIYWRWYDRMRPAQKVNEDTVIVTFKADLTTAIESRGFTPGDTVVIKSGWNKTASEIYTTGMMIKEGLIGNMYTVTDTIITSLNDDLQYNFYVVKDGIEYREIFYDFTDTEGGSAAEKRKVTLTSNTQTVEDFETDVASLRRQPNFRNLDPISQDITVYFEVDLRPAYYTVLSGKTLKDIQGNFDVTEADSVLAWGVRINGPATGGWNTWGTTLQMDTSRTMYDDGTHGDVVAGDSIFTMPIMFPAGTAKGQEFKFGIKGGDNEGGYGNNHIENLDDSQTETYLRSQFGSIDPLFYNAWNFEDATGIDDLENSLPAKYALNQNYPNPFNPTTTISYSVPKASRVTLTIFNVLGQKIYTLINNRNTVAGTYLAKWNGLDQAGNKAASGIYFYKIQAGNYTAVKKMILMK